ncbi:MAG: hypothetical protein ABI783_02340 [Actinomycetota bacterium]
MTRKSLVIGIVVASLAVGVPGAFGEGSLAGSQEPSNGVAYFYSVERATAGQASGTAPSSYRDAFERGGPTKPAALPTPQMMAAEDGFDRAVAAKLALQSSPQSMFRRTFDPDLFQVETVSARAPVSAPNSSTQIEWLQIGIGFGIGVVLALALWLAVRLTKGRTLAHG